MRAAGEPYAYALAEELIEKELFGVQPKQGSEPSQPTSTQEQPDLVGLIESMRQSHDREVDRLTKLLEAEKREKIELLKYAQDDKKLFAEAASNLTRVVLKLPGPKSTEQRPRPASIDGDAVEKNEQEGSEQSSTDTTSAPSADQDNRPWFKRLFPSR